MSTWKEYKIKDLGDVITGKTPSSNFPDEFGSEMPFVTPTDYKNFRKWAYTADRHLSMKGIEKLKTKILPQNSLLVTCIGSDMGKVVLNKVPVITNQQINSIVPNLKIVDPDFLYYKILENYETLRMFGQAGSAVPIVNKGDFEEIIFEMPSELKEQQLIANILSCLDDKIDILNYQNHTLEQFAETIFRQWFFEENTSETIVNLNDYVNCINGVSYKSSELNPSNTALVSLKSFNRNGGFNLDGFKDFTGRYKEQQLVKEGDLVVAHTDITQEADVIGNPALIISSPIHDTLVISMDMVKVVPKEHWISNEFLYFLMRSREFKHHCLGCSNGTTVLHLSKIAVPSFEFAKPEREKVITFTNQAKNLISKIFVNHKEIHHLVSMRESLLPKLMSGELKIN